MTPQHHPDPDELIAYASGTAPEWASLVVACHLTYCAECRSETALLDELGGALLDAAEPDGGEPGHAAGDVTTRAPTPREPAPVVVSEATRALPRPLHAYFRDASPRWRFLAPGVKHIPLSFSVGGVPARVVRFEPGFTVPDHAHQGLEMVLVLDGELVDSATREVFRTGDLSRRDQGSSHSQHITSKDPCVCLVVSAAPIAPRTTRGRLLQLLTGV